MEEASRRESFKEALERIREEEATALANKYYDMAKDDPATMRHAIDKVIPNAKQEIGVTGSIDHGLSRESIIALMSTKEGREAALAITKALTQSKR